MLPAELTEEMNNTSVAGGRAVEPSDRQVLEEYNQLVRTISALEQRMQEDGRTWQKLMYDLAVVESKVLGDLYGALQDDSLQM